jgi:HEAT repeat protein
VLLLCALVSVLSCSRDPLHQLIRQLDQIGRREEAIEGLLQLVRHAPRERAPEAKRQVVDALMEAYRDDENRGEIVAALATLHDGRAEPVFVAALHDAGRGGPYLEAAVRAAHAVGKLRLQGAVPVLIEVLRKASSWPRAERNTWLERALIQALDHLGDLRAVDALIRVLRGDPAQQDFYLNKLAATALGHLKDPRSVPALVASLSAGSQGLLVFEESRRALCQIGGPATAELLRAASRRDRRQQPEQGAAAAVQVLGDIGDRSLAPRLADLLRGKDPLEYRLAVAEAQLRFGDTATEGVLREIVKSEEAPLTARRKAADLMGWYGSMESAAGLLQAACRKNGPAGNVLCWSAALAFARLAGPRGLSLFDSFAAAHDDAATRHTLETYRPRLALAAACGEEGACYRKKLAEETDWRAQERAALELGRAGTRGGDGADGDPVALELARAYGAAHPQLKEAILVTLERLTPALQTAREVADLLGRAATVKEAKEGEVIPPSIVSRALCLGQRLYRASGEKR